MPRASMSKVPAPGSAIAFAIGALVLGMAAPGVGYGIFGPSNDVGLIDPPIWPARWFFWAIWIVLYPTIGVAGSHAWHGRHRAGGLRAWSWLLASFLVGLSWVPIVQASGSRLVMPVVMDLIGLSAALIAFAAVRRVSMVAAWWLLPSLAWGLITTVLKIWRFLLNGGLG